MSGLHILPADKTPCFVWCVKCRHEWVVAWLPMEMSKAAALMKRACCPNCGALTKDVRMGNAPAEEANLDPAIRLLVQKDEA